VPACQVRVSKWSRPTSPLHSRSLLDPVPEFGAAHELGEAYRWAMARQYQRSLPSSVSMTTSVSLTQSRRPGGSRSGASSREPRWTLLPSGCGTAPTSDRNPAAQVLDLPLLRSSVSVVPWRMRRTIVSLGTSRRSSSRALEPCPGSSRPSVFVVGQHPGTATLQPSARRSRCDLRLRR